MCVQDDLDCRIKLLVTSILKEKQSQKLAQDYNNYESEIIIGVWAHSKRNVGHIQPQIGPRPNPYECVLRG